MKNIFSDQAKRFENVFNLMICVFVGITLFLLLINKNNKQILQKNDESLLNNEIKTSYDDLIINPEFETSMVLVYEIIENAIPVYLPIKDIKQGGQLKINWGDGETSEYNGLDSYVNHTYQEAGIYVIEITDNFIEYSTPKTNSLIRLSNKQLIQVYRFNDGIKILSSAFYEAENLIKVPNDIPSNVTHIDGMFEKNIKLNQEIDWSIPNVVDVNSMFDGAISFNSDVKFRNSGNVVNAQGLFRRAEKFNSRISFDDTTSLEITNQMFMFAKSYNQPIGFDTSNVIDMGYMFYGAQAFNQEANFNTENVTMMYGMFLDTPKFNKKITFDTKNVTDMSLMFSGAKSFNQPVNFDTTNVENMYYMFQGAKVFNQPIDFTSNKLVLLDGMFSEATEFNSPVNFGDTKIQSTKEMFSNAVSFDATLNINTSEIINMSNMFFNATVFNQPVEFDTQKVEHTDFMFAYATKFNQPINFSGENLKSSRYMFYGAYEFNKPVNITNTINLTQLEYMFANASSFNQELVLNIPNAVDISFMFYAAESFNSNLDFITDNLIYINSMFASAKNFNKPLNFNTSKVQFMQAMFRDAEAFNETIIFDTSNVINMQEMFLRATSFNQELNFDTLKVEDMSYMFYLAKNFNKPLNFNTSKVKYMQSMFREAESFNQPLDFDASNVIKIEEMFLGATSFNQELSLNTEKVTDMSYMFFNATSFNQPLDLNTEKVENMRSMFEGASEFNQDLNFDTRNVKNMISFLKDAKKFNGTLNFNTENVTNMWGMFYYAESFNQRVDFDTRNVEDMQYMFLNAKSFNQPINFYSEKPLNLYAFLLNAESFNNEIDFGATHITRTDSMLSGAINFNQPINIDTSNVEYMQYMFSGTHKFNQPVDNLDYRNVKNFDYMFLNSGLSNENYNNFILRLYEQKDELAILQKNTSNNMNGLKRYKSNKDIFDELENDGLIFLDDGYITITVKPKNKIITIGEEYSIEIEIEGVESEEELYNFLSTVKYTVEEINGPGEYEITPFGLESIKYYIEYQTGILFVDPIFLDFSNVVWSNNLFTYDDLEKVVQLVNLPIEVEAIYTNNKAVNKGKYLATVSLIYDKENYIIINDNIEDLEWEIVMDQALIDDAIQAIENKRKSANDEIENLNNLTEEDKQKYKDQVNLEAEKAKEAIKDSINMTEINNAKDEGIAKIDEILDEARIHIIELDFSNVVWSNNRLTYDNEEKEVKLLNLPEQVKVTYANNKAINKGKYLASFELSYDKNKYKIINNMLIDLEWEIIMDQVLIDDAIQTIENKRKSANDEIENLNNLTEEDKQKYKDQVNLEAEKAKEAIKDSINITEINNAKDEGIINIDQILDNARNIKKQASNKLGWIIIGLSLIIIVQVVLIVMKRKDNKQRLNSIVLPFLFFIIDEKLGKAIIICLVVIMVILLVYILYLFVKGNDIKNIKIEEEKEMIEEETIDIVDEDDKYERYNYSFDARLHQAPVNSQKRFNELKNFLMCYQNMKVKKTWRNERFTCNGKTIVKMWIYGNVLDLYINVDPTQIENISYKYVGDKKVHENTPILYKVTTDGNLKNAYRLLELSLEGYSRKKICDDKNYLVEYIDREKLLEMGLIKIKTFKK